MMEYAIGYALVGLFHCWCAGYLRPQEVKNKQTIAECWGYFLLWPLGLPVTIVSLGAAHGFKRIGG